MMQEGLDDGPDFLSEEDRGVINVDLQTDATLQVDISDALSERDKVKFTVHTKSTLPNFKQNEFSVVRQHEEFIWLHDSFVENEEYAGYIVSTELHQRYSVVESQMAPYKVVHYIGNRVPFWDVLALRIST
uniref:SNX6 n=1 Tax=Oncorhynchus kisutch TaxID=8019 RepID=A0A8C7HXQ6_ONCKI